MSKLSKDEIKAIKLKARNEFVKEQSEEIINKLKSLYVKLGKAEDVALNIKREIEDYEMKLEG